MFSQVMEFVPYYQFQQCVKRYNGHHRIKHFTCWEQLLAMIFGQLAYRESLRDVVICLRAQQAKLYHLGFSSLIAKTTLAKANERRDWRIYRDFAQVLIQKARKLYADDKEFNLKLDGTCYVLDSTTIELCLNVFKWATFMPTKAAVKLHTLMDIKGNIPTFFHISSGKVHDVHFLDILDYEVGAYYIMDRGYLDYERFYRIHQARAFFITRAKSNLAFKRLYSNKVDKTANIKCDQVIRFFGYKALQCYPDTLRRIKYFDAESSRHYVFLTNDLNVKAKTIAYLYKHRWRIEIFFKWIKQHLKIRAFWGYSSNAVKTQICIAICAYLIVAIMKKQREIDLNLYEILQILSVSLFDKMALNTLFSRVDLQIFEAHPQKQPTLWGF